MRSPVIPVQLITPDLPVAFGLEGESWLACGVSSYREMTPYAFVSAETRRDPSIGQPCRNVRPREDNTFRLELAVVLPDLFPALEEGKYEYALDVLVEGLPKQRIAVSNMMSKVRYQANDIHYHALVHRSELRGIRSGEQDLIPKDAPEEPLRTFVSSQFRIPGTTAADALDENLSDTFDIFLVYLNHLLRHVSMVDESTGAVYSTAYTRSTFDAFYFVLVGDSTDPDHLCHGQVAPHAGRAFMSPMTLPTGVSDQLRGYLAGTMKPADTAGLLHAAEVYLQAGATDYSVLLSVVAAEIATRRFVVERYLALGVSKKKLDDYEGDIKFSMLLNVEMFALAPADMKPDRNLVGGVNRARDLRNDYMHNGKQVKDKSVAATVIRDVKEYIEYVERVRVGLQTK